MSLFEKGQRCVRTVEDNDEVGVREDESVLAHQVILYIRM